MHILSDFIRPPQTNKLKKMLKIVCSLQTIEFTYKKTKTKTKQQTNKKHNYIRTEFIDNQNRSSPEIIMLPNAVTVSITYRIFRSVYSIG